MNIVIIVDADNTFTTNNNRYICADQFGYSLTYYDTTGHTDYTSITTNPAFASQSGASMQTGVKNLWNGNIKNMVTSIERFMPNGRPQGRGFRYDQLNRIIGAQVDTAYTVASNSWTTSGGLTKWREKFTYDENGNIQTLIRHGNVTTPMDSLRYHYISGKNQLEYVDDISSAYSDDIDDQAAGNYVYDKIGNLVHDVSQEIDSIQWNVYGKISKVVRTGASSKSDLEFHYDAMGNRVCKIVKPRAGSGILTQENWTYTYYLRDAQGNVIATYDRIFRTRTGGFTESMDLKENDLYGSSRVGVRNSTLPTASVALTTSGYNGDGTIHVTSSASPAGVAAATNYFVHQLGQKSYELVNHLGNVLVTVSDARTVNHVSTTITGWNAVVNSATDYYAFGSPMEGRSYTSTSYRYSFNGKEKDDETGTQNYGMRIYNPSLGRFLSVDPMQRQYPGNSTYCFSENDPISSIDLDGLEKWKIVVHYSTFGQAPALDVSYVPTWSRSYGSTGILYVFQGADGSTSNEIYLAEPRNTTEKTDISTVENEKLLYWDKPEDVNKIPAQTGPLGSDAKTTGGGLIAQGKYNAHRQKIASRALTGEAPVLQEFYDEKDSKEDGTIDVDYLASYLIANPTAELDITGRTDRKGKDEDNITLSQARADGIKDAILLKVTAYGYDGSTTGSFASRIDAVGAGETRAAANGDLQGSVNASERTTEVTLKTSE